MGLGAVFLAWSLLWGDGWALTHHEAMTAWFDHLPQAVRLGIKWALWIFYVGYAACFVVGLCRGDRRLVRAALIYLAAQLIFSLLVVRLLKMGLGRPRPFAFQTGWSPLTFDADHHAMPSGHATDAMTGYGVAVRFFRSGWVRVLSLILSLVILASRVAGGQHYPSDVVTGALIGYLGSVFLPILWVGWLEAKLVDRKKL